MIMALWFFVESFRDTKIEIKIFSVRSLLQNNLGGEKWMRI
jgi:hypothetical protein